MKDLYLDDNYMHKILVTWLCALSFVGGIIIGYLWSLI